MADAEVQVLQSEIASIKERLEKQDESQKRIWERIDQQAKDMVRIQVIMENVDKSMSEIKISLATISTNQSKVESKADSKWTSFFEKSFWLALGAAVTYFSNKH